MTESDAKEVENLDTRPSLKTERLVLRPFQIRDEEDVFRICGERAIAASTRTIPHPYPRAQAQHWIKQHPELWQTGKSAIFAVCEKQAGRLVGAIGLEINREDQNAEMGYWIDKQCWGNGYCTESAAAALQFGFETLALHKIHAHYITTNPASGRVLEKIGMKKEGMLSGHIRKWGKFYDVVLYGLVNSDFQKSKNTGLKS